MTVRGLPRYIDSRGNIYDRETMRFMGEYTPELLAELNGGSAAEPEKGYEDQTMTELQKVAKSLGLTRYSSLNKAKLIKAIEQIQADTANAADATDDDEE